MKNPSQGGTPMQTSAQTLAGIELFRDLDAASRADIATRCQAHRYAAGEQVLAADDPSRDVLFVVSGSVRVTLFSPAGKEVIFRDQGAGEMLGELAAIDGAPRSAHVVAVHDSLLVTLSPQAFLGILREHQDVNWRVMQRLVRLVRLLSDRVYEFSTLAVPDRVHSELLRLALTHMSGDNTARIDPAPTHAEIASTIGTHREAVTRELNVLAKQGVLSREGHAIVIHDVGVLRRLCQGG